MDEDNNILKIGSNINIKRTDGRVHPAYVAGINFDQDIAMVEWFEHGETKGKEVSFASVTELNSDVIISRPNNQAHVPAEPEVVTQPLPQVYDLRRDSGSSGEETSAAAAQANRYKLDESDDDFNSNQFSPETATLSNPTQANVPSSRSSIARATSRSTRMSYIPSTSNGHTSETANREQAPNFETTRATTNASSNVRCSNVVKEVEKLKRNREERRQKQAEEKAEKEAFLQMAPGNPHWALFNMIQEFRRTLDIRPLNENDTVEDHLITVCVRKRPLNRKEMNKKEVDVITVPSKNQLIVHEPKNKVDLTKYLENQLFRFDYAFDETCTNEMVYRYTAQPLIKTIFEGGFATCFAYGQTGSGKTHTMGGDFVGKNQDCQKGIYGMVAADVFRFIKSSKYRHLDLVVSSSFFEIYSGKVFDLLNNKAKLRILEDGKQQVQVVGLSEIVVSSAEEVLKLIQKGNQARTSGQTFANSNSSRSHAVFQIYLRARNSLEKIHGKFSLIDLAGNERGADTSSADRQTRMEGAEINKSLLALKECIRALSRKGAHLPFRVSKLTLVLKDSFVGSNSRTCMIAMVSPGVNSCEHTLNTLRYADRVKELGAGDLQTPVINEEAENDGDISQLLLNENEMTPEMLNFHQVISELQIAEDNMLDTHKQTIEGLNAVIEKSQKLLRATDGINFDQEAYCNQWEELLNFSSDLLLKAKKSVAEFRTKLIAEEQLSRHSNK